MPSFRTSTPARPTTLPIESNGSVLPSFVHEYLSSGAPEGTRNDTIYRVAQQFHAAGLSQSEAESRILPMAVSQGGERVTREVLASIKNGYSSSRVTEALRPLQTSIRPVSPKAASPMIEALRAAYQPGDRIAICEAWHNGEKWNPGKATIHTLEGWEKRLPGVLAASEGGCYIGINPLKEGAQRRLRDDVAVFRHVLVEWEGIPIDEQERRLRESNLPVSVMVTSGGRSVHGWVRVDASDIQTWEERRDTIFNQLQCDRKNKDVSRVSRLPGFMRGGQEQRLLAINIGAKSWEEWENGSDGLPDIIDLDGLFRSNPITPPEVVKGVLYQGTKMMIGAPSKARKSWVLLDLGLSVASGSPWLGFETQQGKALMINFELLPFMIRERLEKLSKGRNYGNFSLAVKNFHLWNLRGRIHDIAALAPKLIKRIKEAGYSLVILDPIYKGLGARDENHAGDINGLLSELENVARESGAAILYTHHFAKGNAGDKSAIDRASGSGVWARDPDTMMMLTPPPKPKGSEDAPTWDYEVEVVARAHPRIEPFRVNWRDSHYEREGRQYALKPRDGGMASEYGDIIALMPRLRRDWKNNAHCPVINWIKEQIGLSVENCERVFDVLRKSDRYAYLKSEGSGIWRGVKFFDKNPF